MTQGNEPQFKSSHADTSNRTNGQNGYSDQSKGGHENNVGSDEGWVSEFLGMTKSARDIGLPT